MAETKGPITFKLKFKQTTQEATIADHRDSPDGLHLTLIKSLNSLFPNSAKYTPGAISFFKKDSVCYRIDDFSEISENCVIKARIDPERVPLGYCISIDDKPVKVDAPSDFKNTVSLRGLPWESTEEDIRVFFSGLEISGVYINYAGAHTSKHSGEAFVEFITENGKAKALEKDKQCILGRYLEVMEATEKEVRFFKRKTSEELKYANKSVPVDSESIICRLKGIPWETTHGDIERLLTAIHFPKDKSGRPNGMAFVEVADDELCVFLIIKDSLGHNKEFIGRRFAEIRRAPVAELISEMRSVMSDFNENQNGGEFYYDGFKNLDL